MKHIKTFENYLKVGKQDAGISESSTMKAEEIKNIEHDIDLCKQSKSSNLRRDFNEIIKLGLKTIEKLSEGKEATITEGKDFSDMTSALGGGDNDAFAAFFKNAKKGDTFLYAPNGVELDTVNKADLKKKDIELSTESSVRESNPVQCTIIDKKTVNLSGGSFEMEGDETDCIFYTIEGSESIFVLWNTFE